jgi:hypothetical protein
VGFPQVARIGMLVVGRVHCVTLNVKAQRVAMLGRYACVEMSRESWSRRGSFQQRSNGSRRAQVMVSKPGCSKNIRYRRGTGRRLLLLCSAHEGDDVGVEDVPTEPCLHGTPRPR